MYNNNKIKNSLKSKLFKKQIILKQIKNLRCDEVLKVVSLKRGRNYILTMLKRRLKWEGKVKKVLKCGKIGIDEGVV